MSPRALAKSPGCAILLLGLLSSTASAESIVGLTTANSLVTFDSATPGSVSTAVLLSGLGSESILDIDFRPANGVLYGLGSAGNLYSINPVTGAATLNTSLTGVSLDAGATRFGIDFNPTVDRLRIVSNTGQNLRLSPDTGVTTIDLALNGAASSAVSVAYTNNVFSATTTTLFYIGPNSPNTLFNTSNPNGGVLTTVGPLGVSSSQNVGFDISGLSGVAYATLASPTGGGSSLYTINLNTGAASLVGSIGNSLTLRGIAAPVGVPEPASVVMAGIGLAAALGLARYGRQV
jgi:hypothetical protein